MRSLYRYLISHIVIRYIISGGTAAVVNLGVFALLVRFAPIAPIISSVCASCVAFWTSFLLQKFFTFKDGAPISFRQLSTFLLIFLCNLVLTTSLFWVFSHISDISIIDQFCAISITAVFSFFTYRFLVFGSGRNDTHLRS
jgi:putative flippase GtrA